MDLTSRLRAIVRTGPERRELTYEPDTGGYEAVMDLERVGAALGGQTVETPFGRCLTVDRRYEADRRHGDVRIADCEITEIGGEGLRILDPSLPLEVFGSDESAASRTLFIDLETTGLNGGAGTVAFLVGCGYFDLGAFQVRQFLLTSFAGERALLSAVADFFAGVGLIVTYNGKTFDIPMMETRWLFHRLAMPLEGVAHFDMLHPARRLWKERAAASRASADRDDAGCRLTTLERTLFDVTRVGDVPGLDIPRRFFQFVRSGNPNPLEPVLEHNRMDLVSLAAVMARAVRLTTEGATACRDCQEALMLGRVYERAGRVEEADGCYRRASASESIDVRAEALYRLGLRLRRERRFVDAAEIWRGLMALTEPRAVRRLAHMNALRQFAAEALAIHHEHRDRDLEVARELALFALEDAEAARADGMRYRLARLDRKIKKDLDAHPLWSALA